MTHNEMHTTPAAESPSGSTGNSQPWMLLNSAFAAAASCDILSVETVLKASIRSTQSEPKTLGDRLIGSGGKRLRPYLLCLMARSLGHKASSTPANSWRGSEADLHHLGAVSELVHTATLFHDDVIDQSETRRGMTAAHILNGNKSAVLVGDFVYAEAFYVLMERGLLDPSRELAKTVKTIVDGELLQLRVCQSRSIQENEYMQIANAKTASLFAWCTGTGAWVAGSQDYLKAAEFGRLLGLAFQMADDLIDTFEINPTTASEADLISWLESAPPLPLILACNNPAIRTQIEALWKEGFENPTLTRKREIVSILQNLSQQSQVVEQSLKLVSTSLNEARLLLKHLGNESDMAWTLDTIQERAEQGAALSKMIGISHDRHVIT